MDGDGVPLAEQSDGNLHVLAWRMKNVEGDLKSIDRKLDAMAGLYVTDKTLEILLSPLRSSILELKTEEQEKEKRDSNYRAQLKLALVVASVSPVISAIFAFVVGSR